MNTFKGRRAASTGMSAADIDRQRNQSLTLRQAAQEAAKKTSRRSGQNVLKAGGQDHGNKRPKFRDRTVTGSAATTHHWREDGYTLHLSFEIEDVDVDDLCGAGKRYDPHLLGQNRYVRVYEAYELGFWHSVKLSLVAERCSVILAGDSLRGVIVDCNEAVSSGTMWENPNNSELDLKIGILTDAVKSLARDKLFELQATLLNVPPPKKTS